MSEQEQQTGGRGWLKIAGIGCLVIVVLGIITTVVVVMNFKKIATSTVVAMAKAGIDESELPAEQKIRINTQIDRVAKAYLDDRISEEQLSQIMETLQQTPLLMIGMVYVFETQHLDTSDMTAEQKQTAKRTLERFARGSFEETIDPEEFDAAISIISVTDTDGSTQIKDQLTRQELDRFLAALNTAADDAQVPDEPFEVDIATQIESAVDTVLGEESAAP
jgi:hypothetical protein